MRRNNSLRNLGLAGLAALTVAGCNKYEDSGIRDGISFQDAIQVVMPQSASNSQKRGFADFTGDGIEDMVQVNGTWGNYTMEIFPGFENREGYLQFSEEEKYQMPLPVTKGWFKDDFKFDTADVNGDGYADLVLSEIRNVRPILGSERLETSLKYAINDQNSGFNFEQSKDSGKERMTLDKAINDMFQKAANDGRVTFENYKDRLKMDWADFNGDGFDDFAMFWKDSNDVYADILISHGDYTFSPTSTTIEGLVSDGYSIRRIDTEDMNGDGAADIVAFNYSGEDASQRVVLTQLQPGFIKLDKLAEAKFKGCDLDWSTGLGKGFEKRDLVDANFDGLADYAHFGRLDYIPISCYAITELK